MRSRSGVAIGAISFMVHLIGEHGTQNGMTQMVVALIAGEIGEQVLDGVVDVFFRGNALVVAIL